MLDWFVRKATMTASATLVCLVSPRQAKGIKEYLKANKWLDKSLKTPPASCFDGRIAFPILEQCAEAVQDAIARGDEALAAVDSVERIDASLETRNRPPPQGKKAGETQNTVQGVKLKAKARQKPPSQPRSFGRGGRGGLLPPAPPAKRLRCPPGADHAWFCANVSDLREPVVLEGLDLGKCVGGWTAEHLAEAPCASDRVSVHVCPSDTVDLAGHRCPNTPRNFEFRNMPFPEAVWRCAQSSERSTEVETCSTPPREFEPILAAGEKYYLRSVGVNARKDAADFPSLFPSLASECNLLPGSNPAGLVASEAYHSSVLRLASDDTQLWTHFDIMDNLLAQVTGRKRVVLWPPSEDGHLYVEGSSSRVGNVERFNDDEFPLFRRSLPSRTEAELGPGDVLYLPALWFHNVTSIGFSVAVNVFWRSHHSDGAADVAKLYDKKVLVATES